MSNDLAVFGFEGMDVRVLDQNGDPWFVLKDVCTILGLANVADTAIRLDDDEKLYRSDLSSLGQRGGRHLHAGHMVS